MPKKRIMILGMSPKVGGVESYIMNLLRNINHEKYEFYFPFYNEIAYHDELIALGGNLIHMEVSRHNPYKYIKYVGKLFRKYKFDVVYYNTCDIMSMDMVMFGKKFCVPIRIIHSHNSSNIVKPNFLHRCTETWCRKNLDQYATKLLACSDVAGEWMFDGREYEVVNNGIDVKKFSYSQVLREKIQEKLGIRGKLVIGFVGSLWEQKNPIFLLDIFAKVREKRENAVLLIVGTGSLRNDMEKRAKELDVYDDVLFLGVRKDVASIMSAMDRFVLPSKFEGLPFVLVEAQASGLPCITSTNVSQESNLTGEMKFLTLETDLDIWADTVIQQESKFDRREYSGIVQSKGFDILTTVNQVEQYFEGK